MYAADSKDRAAQHVAGHAGKRARGYDIVQFGTDRCRHIGGLGHAFVRGDESRAHIGQVAAQSLCLAPRVAVADGAGEDNRPTIKAANCA